LKTAIFKDKVQFQAVFVLKNRRFQGQTIPGTQQIVGFPLASGPGMPYASRRKSRPPEVQYRQNILIFRTGGRFAPEAVCPAFLNPESAKEN